MPACSDTAGNDAFWQAWCDGAALPNPGKLGIGVVLVSPAGDRTETSALADGHGCNNEAELHALCAALDMALAAGARRLALYSDSDVAVRYVRGPDGTQIERLHRLVIRARERLREFDELRLTWIPRHRNGAADELSRRALGLPPTAPAALRRRRAR